VKIPDDHPERKKAPTHERFHDLTGKLELDVIVVSEYLFVGSGDYEFNRKASPGEPDVWYTFYRRNGQICIPGTSIKGSIRSILEAISNSCVSQFHGEVKRISHRPCRGDELCPACRIFGTTGYRGRLNFSDSFVEDGFRKDQIEIVKIPELWKPGRPKDDRRFYETKQFQPLPNKCPEKNFRFVEALRKDTKIRTTMQFENLAEEELGLVLHALGWKLEGEKIKDAFWPKLGGAKPRCLGAVKFEPSRLQLLSPTAKAWLSSQIKERTELLDFLVKCMKECEKKGLLHQKSWEELVRALQPKNAKCPGGVY
jgi:CRISPR/Cas system CSM-associated protein Csm3 (group 7 of RAMP superfamily)